MGYRLFWRHLPQRCQRRRLGRCVAPLTASCPGAGHNPLSKGVGVGVKSGLEGRRTRVVCEMEVSQTRGVLLWCLPITFSVSAHR